MTSPLRVALVYPRLFHQVRSFLAPLGLISIATVIRDAGHDVHLLDPSFDKDLTRVARQLSNLRPQVVGFSLSTDLYPAARDLCRHVKKLGATTVMGGPHPTLCADEIFRDCPELDMIVSGEGEHAFPLLLARLERSETPTDVPGVAYRDGDAIVTNPPSDWIEDIDALPLPDRDLLPTYERYSSSGYTGLVLTRGCPFSCAFCQPALTRVAGRFRSRGARSVVDEIEALYHRHGNRCYHIDDDLFVLHRGWIAEICDEMGRQGLLGKLRFIVLSRVDLFDDELVQLLKRMGVYYVMFGVESGSQAVLDSFDKKITQEKIEKAFGLAHANGLKTHAFVILGSPGETLESLANTEALVERLDPTSLFMSQYAPLPGTALREELQRQGRLNISSHEQMSYFSWAGADLPIRVPGVSRADVIATRDRILARRRFRFLLPNVAELLRLTLEKRSLTPMRRLGRFYLKKRHFNG